MARLTINDQPVEIRLDADVPLLWGLRDAAGLTGTKYGCGNGDCGACMVIVDGAAMKSCTLTLGESEGRVVTTIEGLSAGGLHPVQRAMIEVQAVQCGFCTPGIVMAAAALLQRNADPSSDEIGAAITNICRCGVYPRLVPAIQRAGAAMRSASNPPPAAPQVAGAGASKVEAKPDPAEPAPDATYAPRP